MKNVGLKVGVVGAALVAGLGAVATMPTGRAMSAQEKFAVRGLDDGDYQQYLCKVCGVVGEGEGRLNCTKKDLPVPPEEVNGQPWNGKLWEGKKDYTCSDFEGIGAIKGEGSSEKDAFVGYKGIGIQKICEKFNWVWRDYEVDIGGGETITLWMWFLDGEGVVDSDTCNVASTCFVRNTIAPNYCKEKKNNGE